MQKNIFDEQYPITKMHGTGNDFVVYVDFDEQTNLSDVRKICDRHFGIGADGVVTVVRSRLHQAKYRMKFFDPDGSTAEMCGNGIRCFAKYLIDNKLISGRDQIPVDTDAGIIIPEVLKNSPQAATVLVDMGKPVLYNPSQITFLPSKKGIVSVPFISLTIKDKPLQRPVGTFVNIGVPHIIFFVKKNSAEKLANQYGAQIGKMKSLFPQKINVDFTEVNNKNELTLHVWERGAGLTLACGTGACAALVAAVLNGYVSKSAKVHLPGGTLKVSWDGSDSHVFMTGPAVNVFQIENLDWIL